MVAACGGREVGANGDRLVSLVREDSDRLGRRRVGALTDNDKRAGPGEPSGDSEPDPGAASGDYRDSAR